MARGERGKKGLWLKIAQKESGIASGSGCRSDRSRAVSRGWIDGLKRSCDAKFFLRRFTPRRPRSLWSKISIAHVERLTTAGRMQPAGLREVEAAKADGRWQAAYDSATTMEVHAELAAAGLANNRKAKDASSRRSTRPTRYAVCWRVQTAKEAGDARGPHRKAGSDAGAWRKIH